MSEWQHARLLSRSGIDGDADARPRATEALLAVIALVPPYATALMKSLGAGVDNRATVETFVDVRLGAVRAPVADGVVRITRGSSSWSAALVVRVGKEKLDATQIKRVRAAAAKAGMDAVVTVSNAAEGPGLGRSRSTTPVHHWPWGSLLGAATDLKVRDVEQSHLLGELVGFLSHPDANVASFGDMGPSWPAVLKTARNSRLSARDPGVADVCRRWEQVVSHAALAVGRTSGRDVTQVLSAAHTRDPEKRLAALVESVTSSGQLDGVLRITDAAGELAVVADLPGRRLVTVVVVQPPKGLGARATLGWLLDGLVAAPAEAVVESWKKGGRAPLAAATIAELNRDMGALSDARGRMGDSYRVLVTSEMGTARSTTSRSQGFVESVTDAVTQTWTSVLGPLSGASSDVARSSRAKPTRRKPPAPKRRASKPRKPARPAKRKTTTRSRKTTRRSKTAAQLARELRAGG